MHKHTHMMGDGGKEINSWGRKAARLGTWAAFLSQLPFPLVAGKVAHENKKINMIFNCSGNV